VLALAHAKADAIVARLREQQVGRQHAGVSCSPAGHGPTNPPPPPPHPQEPLDRGLLITCDQVVTHEGRILEKPESLQEARQMMEGYRRSPASTVGSVLATNLATGSRHAEIEVGAWRRELGCGGVGGTQR